MHVAVGQYKFKNYVLLPTERLLMLGGCVVPLKSKVFETLLTLVRHPGRLLTKQQLMDEIWGDSFVEESNLAQNIFTLRKIFREKPGDHKFIVTVPGRGYRFVAKVQTMTATGIDQISVDDLVSTGTPSSLAVLPLKWLLPKRVSNHDRLGLAIADSLIAELGKNKKFAIRPTEVISKYLETEMDPLSIGRELMVDNIVCGTLQTADDRVRANIRLHEVNTGDTLWSGKFDVFSDDFFELQDQISVRAGKALAELETNSAAESATGIPEIYQTYIKYRFFWETRTEEGLRTSLKGAEAMTAAEPEYPLGHVGVADSYLLLGHHLYLPPGKVYPAVRAAVDRALELDPELAEAHATKADLCFITRNWAEAELYHRRSIALRSDYASGRHWYSWFLMAMGRFDEAFDQIGQGQQMDPNSLYLGTVRGVPLIYLEQYEQAIKQFRLVLDVDPNYSRARYYLALTLFKSGDWNAGIAEYKKVVAVEPIQQSYGRLGYCYGAAGMKREARQILKRLDRIEATRYVSPYVRAYVHAGLGENDRALDQLELAYKENAIWLVWVNVDLSFEDLRDEPRFKRLIDKMKFPTRTETTIHRR